MKSRTAFWNSKILGWEQHRYPSLAVQDVENYSGNSVGFRMLLAVRIAAARVKGARVLDLGCGSGRFLGRLAPFGPEKLTGFDLSDTAIQSARAHWPEPLFTFQVADVTRETWPDADLVTGLGLLDWLSNEERELLFQKLAGRDFLFSFSERRASLDLASLKQLAHLLYVRVAYGWRNGGYVPRYDLASDISQLAKSYGYNDLYFFRHSKLSFGTLISSFPIPEIK